MDDYVWLEDPIHVSKFMHDKFKVGVDEETGEDKFEQLDLESETFTHLHKELLVSIDGSIMGVKRSMIEPYLNEPLVRGVRMGVKKMPDKFVLENEADFFRLLAILVPVSEIM